MHAFCRLVPVFAAAESWFLLACVAELLGLPDAGGHAAKAEEAITLFREQ